MLSEATRAAQETPLSYFVRTLGMSKCGHVHSGGRATEGAVVLGVGPVTVIEVDEGSEVVTDDGNVFIKSAVIVVGAVIS
jgi:hypothetical protein